MAYALNLRISESSPDIFSPDPIRELMGSYYDSQIRKLSSDEAKLLIKFFFSFCVIYKGKDVCIICTSTIFSLSVCRKR